jgi:hypothetical protein
MQLVTPCLNPVAMSSWVKKVGVPSAEHELAAEEMLKELTNGTLTRGKVDVGGTTGTGLSALRMRRLR